MTPEGYREMIEYSMVYTEQEGIRHQDLKQQIIDSERLAVAICPYIVMQDLRLLISECVLLENRQGHRGACGYFSE